MVVVVVAVVDTPGRHPQTINNNNAYITYSASLTLNRVITFLGSIGDARSSSSSTLLVAYTNGNGLLYADVCGVCGEHCNGI